MDRTWSRRGLLGCGVAVALGGAGMAWLRRPQREPVTTRFPALGTWVTFVVVDDDVRRARHTMAQATRDVFAVHAGMTRFEPSPVTDVNEGAHRRGVAVPEDLGAVLAASQQVTRASSGLFDVTVGALVAAPPERRAALQEGVGPGNLEYDARRGTVRLGHPKTAVDVNGIAKGFAVDRAAARIRAAGFDNFIVNAGGDLFAAGRPAPWQRGWDIRVTPWGESLPAADSLVVCDAAVATSGNAAQPETAPGRRASHLFDPRTGEARDPVLSATAVAATAMEADAWATAAFVAGAHGCAALFRPGSSRRVILVTQDERLVRFG